MRHGKRRPQSPPAAGSDDGWHCFGDRRGCCRGTCLSQAGDCRDVLACAAGPLAVGARLKPRQPKPSEYPERVRPRPGETWRGLALRIGASVWVVVVLSTLGIIYLVRKTIHGAGAEVSIFDGFDVIAYIGLAAALAPSMLVMLVSTWRYRAKGLSVIDPDRLCDICSGSGQVSFSIGEPGRECVACAGTGERDYGAARVMSFDRKQAPDE